MQKVQLDAHIQSAPSAATSTPSVPPSALVALTIDPRAEAPHRPTSIPTPPPTAHPHLHSHSRQLAPTNLHVRVTPGIGEIQHQHQLATRMQNPQCVSSIPPGYQQQQQALHTPNVITHAQFAPPPPPPPQIQTQPPIQPPSTQPRNQQQQQQQPKVTHPPATMLASSQEHQYRFMPPLSAQIADAVRLHGLQHTQARAQGQQAQRPASTVPDPSGTQTRAPLRAMQPPTHMPERAQTIPASASAPSSSRPQSHSHQSQQQQQEDRFVAPPVVAAFRVLQPAKALLEKTWATAIAAVQHELAVVQTEHTRGAREQQRLAELLQRAQAERAQALQALQETQAQLRDCRANIQLERRARLHVERKLAEVLKQCTCGAAAAVKKPHPPSLPTQLSLTSSSSPLPPSPVAPAPGLATVNSKDHPALVHTPAPRTGPSSPADKPRELRREREEETADGESAPKRRRITPTPAPTSSPARPATAVATAPWSAPVPGAVPSPKVAEPQKAAEVIVPADEAPGSHLQDAPQSAPTPDSTLPQLVAAPEQSEDPNAAADVAAVPRKIGIQHIQLAYETVGQTLQCRMCLLRKREVDEDTQVATYPMGAAYAELVGHCEKEHEAALDALASMTPSEIAEMQQRMQKTL
ncbi:hypothetical protein BJV78DRAFT_1251630 [Lactifluus subvellereus]|nr:hypothetical protein BJV78DRAFT_1251630 [Lactifluus subvellereus]